VKTALSRFWYATLFLLTAVSMMFAAEPSPIPKRFSAYIGGFMGASYKLELRDGVLTYTTFGSGYTNPKHTTIKPTEAQWREFRQTLDDLKVWQWRGEYPTDGTVDGTQWSLDVSFADHTLKAHGDNSYPDATGKPNGKPEPTKAFNRYLAAVQKLIGGKTFE
jgi:hypothetical protein